MVGGGGQTEITRNNVIKFFRKEEFFSGQRYRKMEGQKRRPGLAYSLGFAKEKGLEPKLKRFPKLS